MMKFIQRKKMQLSLLAFAALNAMFAAMAMASPAPSPAANQDVVDAIDNGLQSVQLTGVLVLTAVVQVGIVFFAAVFCWKYGKKIFQIVAR